MGQQKSGVALVHAHPAPDLGNQQADVVIHPVMRPYVARRGSESGVPGQDERYQGVVQIHHRRQRVKGGLGKRALAAEAGCRRRLAGQAANEIHEQLRQFLVMDRTVNSERRQTCFGIRRAVSSSREHRVDRQVNRPLRRNSSRQASGDLGQVKFYRILEIGPPLQIPRVRRARSVDQARVGRRNHVVRLGPLDETLQKLLHRLGVLIELDHMFHQGPRRVDRDRLEIGEEIPPAGDIRLRLRVYSPLDGVVGPLEQQALAVRHQFDARVVVFGVKVVEGPPWEHDRDRDVILHLHFLGRTKIRPQLVNPPGALRIVAHAQVIAHQFLIVEFQFVSQKAVDPVHRKMLAPVIAPVGLVVTFQCEDQLAYGLRKLACPRVVPVGVVRRRR